MQVLGWLMYPLVAAWAVYSLVYHHHRSWWSWLIRAMANGVYLWGFIAMTPQLYINYRLKSVAHLPWRSFMYKVRDGLYRSAVPAPRGEAPSVHDRGVAADPRPPRAPRLGTKNIKLVRLTLCLLS